MNTKKSYTSDINPSFSTVLKTVESYEFFERAIELCDDLNKNYNLSGDERIAVIEIMIGFRRMYRTMNTPDYFDYTKLSPKDIKKYNHNYNYIFNLRESSQLIELPLAQRLPDKTHELGYTPSSVGKREENITGKVLQFPRIENSQIPEVSLENLIPATETMPPTERVSLILRDDTFTSDGKFKSEKERKKHRIKISYILGNPVDQAKYWTDCKEADKVGTFHRELDDSFIEQLKKDIIKRKDGKLAQAIKNNLIKHAANDDIFDPNTCRSLILAEHIKNLTPENPITVNTIEFGICTITSIKTVDYGDECYYEMCMIGANGGKSYLRIRANAFIVGDLSNKIVGKMNEEGNWINTALPCTIRNIRSTLSEKKSEIINLKDRTTNFLKKSLNGIKNLFGFRENNMKN